MKIIFTLALFLQFTFSYSQWTRVQQLPASDIFSLYHKDSILYAGGTGKIYFSRDKGQSWDSTSIIPQFGSVDNIIVYQNELYVASFSIGVSKSTDEGMTWQNISAGIFPGVSDFCEFNGNLFAATLGSSVFELNPATRSNWLFFSSGLSDLSANITSIAGNNNALVAGTLANGLYDYLPRNSTNWEERFLLGQIDPNEGAYDIITAHDSLFLAGHTGRVYLSTDNGLHWDVFGNRLGSANISIVNAKQALLLSRTFVENGSLNTAFRYVKKNSLQDPFVTFSSVPDHFTWRLEIAGDKLWDASNKGLFFMSLSGLPGISSADDTVNISLPVHFVLFNLKCQGNGILLTWKTAQEQNSSHFNVERSTDGIRWTIVASLPAAGNSGTEKSYSFHDNNPVENGYYRVAQYDLDGRVQYTSAIRSSCNLADVFSVSPNPSHDIVFINIATSNESQGAIKVFDSKGALVKMQRAAILPGSNQLRIDISTLANGVYTLSADWNNGQMKKVVHVVKW